MTAEHQRLAEAAKHAAHWRRWGPYLSERQWGTVREDYSPDGAAWNYLPHEHARSRAYRWGEDGLLGISDNHQRLCFAISLWNGKDPILKERLFGLSNSEGNHGEDVKEYYFYLDGTPTSSYLKALYKYPQEAFPYAWLVEENQRRGLNEPEFELLDTGIFDKNRYFDIFVEYAKAGPSDILVRITTVNRSSEPATLHLLPTLWFRNTWSWDPKNKKPLLRLDQQGGRTPVIRAGHESLGDMWLTADIAGEALFTENETNYRKLFEVTNASPYVKDAFHEFVVGRKNGTINPAATGTKAALHYKKLLAPGEAWIVRLRLLDRQPAGEMFGAAFDEIFEKRKREADEFYNSVASPKLTGDAREIQRQAFASMIWSRQFYHYVVHDWLNGDPGMPPPPPTRKSGRNKAWVHVYTDDIISMPDKWEYPWFAAWDLAFHCIPYAMIDPDFDKRQLILLTREWYMHPTGQLPAYEWSFDEVNPPVHAWAAWRVYKIDKKMHGRADRLFLERVFQKLLLNFTWWVNRKDTFGSNIFEGGFLGLDNIGVFDRSQQLPTGGFIEQTDATGWMAMYSANMLIIAAELAREDPSYEDIASKFFEHFLRIADAMNHMGKDRRSLWDEEDGFFYDCLHTPDGGVFPLRVRSLVGLIPLFAVEILEKDDLRRLPDFTRRMNWFLEHRPELSMGVTCKGAGGLFDRRILSIVTPDQLRLILKRMLDEQEFLSPYGIRGLSRYHRDHPFVLKMDGIEHSVDYEPAESTTGFFGSNSNWRGPVWMPVNFLMIESLQKFHHYFGSGFKVECPTGSGQMKTLWQVSLDLEQRLIRLFKKDSTGGRPFHNGNERFQSDPNWSNYVLFYEYFNGDNGSGIGASHQTGWTGLIAKLIQQVEDYRSKLPEVEP